MKRSIVLCAALALLAASCATPARREPLFDPFGDAGLPVPSAEGEAPEASAVSGDAQASPREAEPTAQEAVPPLGPPPAESAYVSGNTARISRFALANGIPLVVYRDEGMRTRTLVVSFAGSASLASTEKAGLERLALMSMAGGPAGLEEKDFQALLYRAMASISVLSGLDHACCSLVAPSSRFDKVYPAFAACLTKPALRPDSFARIKASTASWLQQDKASKDGALGSWLSSRAFYGHPYATSPYGNDFTSSLSQEDVRAWIATEIVADRMAIVAVGDFDPAALRDRLDADFGTLPAGSRLPPAPPRWTADSEYAQKAVFGFPHMAWIKGIFACPGMADADGPAFSVAITLLQNLLFQTIRTREGGAYAPSVFSFQGPSPFATIWIERTSEPARIMKWINESVNALIEGKAPSTTEDPAAFSSLSDTIEGWKAVTVSEVYQQAADPSGLALALSDALLYTGDPAEAFRLADRIQAVTAEDVVRVARRWMGGARVSWCVSGGQAALDPIDADEWRAPLGGQPGR